MNFSRRKLFRWLIDTSESINFWFEKTFNRNPKKYVLEKQQDMIPVKELERTIGKNLGL